MLIFIENQILFYIALTLVLFVPGYFLLLAIYGKKNIFSAPERSVITVAASILAVDFLMMTMDRLGVLLTRGSIFFGIAVFSVFCFGIYKFVPRKNDSEVEKETTRLFAFSKQQFWLILGILLLTMFVRVTYLADNILPSSTDLGHHMYWSKAITTEGSILEYTQRDIESVDGAYQVGTAKNISDFIIGEHLIFAAIALLSGLDFVSYFPVVTLFLINTMSLLAIFILTPRFFKNHPQAKNIAILTLFFIGPLFAISPPQAKYVAGGVIGNIIGNLLVPVSLYFFYRALKEQSKLHAIFAIFVAMGLFYTHHLTGLILLFVLFFSILLLLVFNFRNIKTLLRQWLKLFISWPVAIFLAVAIMFTFGAYTPSYLKNAAVKTVVGGPSKVDHTGLIFSDFKFTLGEPREVLGFVGMALILWLLARRRDKEEFGYANIFLACWVLAISVLSLYPTWVRIDIPSSRVGNYGVFPFAMLASFAVIEIIGRIKSDQRGQGNILVPVKLLLGIVVLVISFAVASGFYDNAQNKIKNIDPQKIAQTFGATAYLAKKTDSNDQILKDHVFVTADAWMKLYFMRDYNFPFYRANLDRYSNGVDKKEFCTLWMISSPATADSQKCFQDLNMNFVMVDKIDAPQFEKAAEFEHVYSNGEIDVFYRPRSN